MNFPEDLARLGGYNLVKFGNNKYLEYFSNENIAKRHVKASAFALSFVIDGTKVIHTPDGKTVGHKGDCLLIGKGHSIMSERIPNDSSPYQNLLFFISDEFTNRFLEKYQYHITATENTPVQKYIAKLKVDDILHNFLISILLIVNNKALNSKEILTLKLEELLLYIVQLETATEFRMLLNGIFADISNDFKSIIRNNFNVNFTAKDYAHLCAMSLSTFKRKFNQNFGTPPGQWIIEKRLALAEKLLKTTPETVETIAQETGYANTSHFIRAFKAAYGVTPAHYRLAANGAERPL